MSTLKDKKEERKRNSKAEKETRRKIRDSHGVKKKKDHLFLFFILRKRRDEDTDPSLSGLSLENKIQTRVIFIRTGSREGKNRKETDYGCVISSVETKQSVNYSHTHRHTHIHLNTHVIAVVHASMPKRIEPKQLVYEIKQAKKEETRLRNGVPKRDERFSLTQTVTLVFHGNMAATRGNRPIYDCRKRSQKHTAVIIYTIKEQFTAVKVF